MKSLNHVISFYMRVGTNWYSTWYKEDRSLLSLLWHRHKYKGRSKVPKPHLCLLPEDLNVRSGWNSYLCVILTCICAYVCVYIHIYLYIYICVQMFDFDFSVYVYLSF